ncbi:hypothetical protein GWK47_007315 [Chionoecetes opilio]|uniref:MARVEL domain-containing protein n=1 Tax=Chionoecetes opilio TaxID=41210 RepID=A0A8J4Y2E9_CHIOP|nr:hypothetical protein GWK47_007315 [Chionoecetes opilio]
MQLDGDVLKTPSAILKLLEIGLTIIIISVSQGVELFIFGKDFPSTTFFCGGVLVTGAVVSCLLLATYLTGSAREIQKTPFEVMVNAVLAVLMVSAGTVTIYNAFKYALSSEAADAAKTAGTFAIINSVFYGLDTYFASQNME